MFRERSEAAQKKFLRRAKDAVHGDGAGPARLARLCAATSLPGSRSFDRPVNYAMLRIRPPPGVKIDAGRRPYLIIDPRAGHGPGIGGFKDDSQVGVALRAGHPVYFVIFFRDPEPGQTLLDVCAAEQQFVKKVRTLHPDSPKPAVIGNCQGGWAAMMLGSSTPDDTGPIVINGAPMSYWGGASTNGAWPRSSRRRWRSHQHRDERSERTLRWKGPTTSTAA